METDWLGIRGITYISLKVQEFDMRKLLLSFLLVSLIMFQGVLAEGFIVKANPEPLPIFLASQTGHFSVDIFNEGIEDWYTITIFGFSEDWVEVEKSLLNVGSNKWGTVDVEVSPARDALPGSYQYFLKVTKLSNNEQIQKPLLVKVRQVTSALIKDVVTSCESCLEEITISGTVHNVGSKTVDLALVLTTPTAQNTINIGKIAIKDYREFESTFSLDDVLPGTYNVGMKLVDEFGKVLYEEAVPFTIPSIEEVYYDQTVSSTPFGSIVTVSAVNRGNVVADVVLRSVNDEEWYYFISGPSPSGMFLESYIWDASLQPGESYAVTYSEIYWPVYVFIIAIVMIASFVYWQTSDIVFVKDAMSIKKFKPGKEFSVSVYLKNKKSELKRVTVRDLIPAGFSVVNKFEAAKPLIKKVGGGIELVWDVGRLDPHEERYFHYTIKPSTGTVRKTSLPSATMKAMGSGRKFFTKRTPTVSLSPEELETTTVTVSVAK